MPDLTAEHRWLLHDAVSRFFACLDGGRLGDLARLFAEDGAFYTAAGAEPAARGREQILALFSARPPTRRTRHLWGGFAVLDGSHDRAAIAFHAPVVAQEGEAPARLAVVFDIQADLRLEAGAWLFENMTRTLAFNLA